MKQDNQEYETKVLDIDPQEIIQKLRDLGAEETSERLMRRWVFDINPKERRFIRLRDDGKRITLTYKHRPSYKVGDTKEIEVEVVDFEKTAEILKNFIVERTFYQENKRQKFILGNIEFCIDTWPMIPPHLEIEAESLAGVQKGLSLLELEGKDVGNLSVAEIYRKKGINIHEDHTVLKFNEN